MANQAHIMSTRHLQPYRQADFVRLVLAEFSELRDELTDADELLHLQMHVFTRLMQRAKGNADWSVYKRGVHLAAELWTRPDAALLNALKVSFLEHLDFDGPHGPRAWAQLTSELQQGWRAMRAYNERIALRSAPPRKSRRSKHR